MAPCTRWIQNITNSTQIPSPRGPKIQIHGVSQAESESEREKVRGATFFYHVNFSILPFFAIIAMVAIIDGGSKWNVWLFCKIKLAHQYIIKETRRGSKSNKTIHNTHTHTNKLQAVTRHTQKFSKVFRLIKYICVSISVGLHTSTALKLIA